MTSLPRGAQAPPEPRSALTPGLIAVLGLMMTVNPVTAHIYLPALGEMASDLGTNIAGAQIALTCFFLGLAGGQLIVGALTDSLGRRRVLLFGLALLTLASLGAAFAPSLAVLLALRVLQGLASSAASVVARAIVADLARGGEAARAYSLLMGMLAAGPLIAPLIGTFLMQLGGWRAIMLGLSVICAGYLIVAAFLIPETLPPARRVPTRLRPLLRNYARLLSDAGFVGNAFSMAFGFAALAVHVSASSFVAQDVLGTDEWGFTFLYMCYAASVMAGSAINAKFAIRYSARRLLVVWQTAAVAATVVLVLLAVTGTLAVWSYLIVIVVGCAAASAILGNSTTLTLGRAAFAAGSGAAMMGFLQFSVGAVVSPVGGVLGPHTAVPMAIGMLGCFVLSALAAAVGRWGERRAPVAS